MQAYFQIFLVGFLVFECDFVAANVEDNARFDCYPERLDKVTVNQTLCEARGCIWKKPVSNQVSRTFALWKLST